MIRIVAQMVLIALLAWITVDAIGGAAAPRPTLPRAPTTASGPAATSPLAAPLPDRHKPADVALFAEILARPVFFEGRRTPVAPAAPREPAVPQARPIAPALPPGLKLSGIRIDGTERTVLVETKSEPLGAWLAIGANVQGWTISRIDPDAIWLMHSGHTAKVDLYRSTSSK